METEMSVRHSKTHTFSAGTFELNITVDDHSDDPDLCDHIAEVMTAGLMETVEEIVSVAPAGSEGLSHYEQTGSIRGKGGSLVEYQFVLDIQIDVPADLLVEIFAILDLALRHEYKAHLCESTRMDALMGMLAEALGTDEGAVQDFMMGLMNSLSADDSQNQVASQPVSDVSRIGFGGYI
jgi:hypothetical protein